MRGYCPVSAQLIMALAIGCGVMSVIVAWQWWRGPIHVGAPTLKVQEVSRAGSQLEDRLVLEELPPIEVFAEMVERPLFDQTRRPPPVIEQVEVEEFAAQQPVKVTEPPPDVRLAGVAIVGADRVALVHGPGAHPARRLKTGAEIEGWIVDDIRPHAIRLRQGEREAVIDLPVPAGDLGVSLVR